MKSSSSLVFFMLLSNLIGVFSTTSKAGSCQSPFDCQLNGACDDRGACVCDKFWKGSTCGDLDFDAGKTIYGNGVTPNTSAWGGGPPIYDPISKKYHLFVTEIEGHCGMSTWTRMSQAAHTVSDIIEGPYVRIGLAIPKQTHNVFYVYSPVDKKHLIYHIFGSNAPESCNPSLKCTNGSSPGANGLRPPHTHWPKPTCNISNGGAHIHYSDSVSGPWMNAGRIKVDKHTPPGIGSSNPAPLIFPNGTVLMLGRIKDARVINGTRVVGHNIFLYRASSWNSTYEFIPSNGINGSLNVGNNHTLTEDPVMWQGRRGFHILFHSHPYLSHAWSTDAINWEWSRNITGPPVYNGADHERPRVIIDANGDLDAILVSSMAPKYEGDDASRLQIFRPKSI